MKRKNILLALISFSLAIGSAFASLLDSELAYIRARPTDTSAWKCTACPLAKCDITAPFVCKIQVNTIASGLKIVLGRRPTTYQCVPSFFYTDTEQVCGVTVHDAQ